MVHSVQLLQVLKAGKILKNTVSRQLTWFQDNGLFPNGVPIDETFARTISSIEPKAFQQCFIDWMQSVHTLTLGKLVAIDGKTLRGSYQPGDRRSTIHMVNAYSSANHLILGQCKTNEKSNEITVIPQLINALSLKGALVSIDAMGCQKEIAEEIINKNADYLLAVKGNQPSLYEAVKTALSPSINQYVENEKIEVSHGRYKLS